MTKSALVILNYNDAETTSKLIEAVRGYESIDRIVVVDNCSPDGSLAALKSFESEKVRVESSGGNRGYAAGNNFGCRFAIDCFSPEYIFIANPDVFFTDGTARAMMNALDADPSAALCAPIVNQGANIWDIPDFGGLLETMLLVAFNIRKKAIKKRLRSSCRDTESIGVAEGSFYCLRTSAYEQVGGLDERTFLYCEENILAKRLESAGFGRIVLTHENYDHLHSKSIRKAYGKKARAFKLFYPSLKLYCTEYLGTGAFKLVIFDIVYGFAYLERVLYDIIKCIKA